MDMIEFTLPRDKYYHRHTEIFEWCVDNFGQNNKLEYRWFVRFAFGDQFISFQQEKDASLFALYWL